MTRRSASTASSKAEPDTEPVDRLAEEARVLRSAIDEFRDEVAWLARNGFPQQPIEHAVVKRMAKDPCAADWAERLEIQRSFLPPPEPTLDPSTVQEIIDRLEASFEAVAAGQLELLLPALDQVRQQMNAASSARAETDSPSSVDVTANQRRLF